MAEKIRIKDIAERAGVSVGTVDRVLHDRPNVSKPAREKVEQALKEMNYQPNMYASALAYNKSYTFYLLLPKHESEAYWEEIEEGARKCEESKRDFHINVKINFYERSNEESFIEQGKAIIEEKPEGVIVVPSSLEITRAFTDQLHELNIPFILLDSYMPDLRPLSFFGQDSFCSGFFAAKMLMMLAFNEKEIMLRLSPEGNDRFIQSESFRIIPGGGEANVAVSVANYGHEAYFVSKLPKHEIGQIALNALRRYGVNTDFIARGGDRVGLYYAETGASMRPSKVIYDRAHSSIAEADPSGLKPKQS